MRKSSRLLFCLAVVSTIRFVRASDVPASVQTDRDIDSFNTWCAENDKKGKEAFDRQWAAADAALAALNSAQNPSAWQLKQDELEAKAREEYWREAAREAEARTNKELQERYDREAAKLRDALEELDAYGDLGYGTALARVYTVIDLEWRRYKGAQNDDINHVTHLRIKIPELLEQAHTLARDNPAHPAHAFHFLEKTLLRTPAEALGDYPKLGKGRLTSAPGLGLAALIARYQAETLELRNPKATGGEARKALHKLNARVLAGLYTSGRTGLLTGYGQEMEIAGDEAFAAALRGAFLDGPRDYNPDAASAAQLAKDADGFNHWTDHWGEAWDASRLKPTPAGNLAAVSVPKAWYGPIADLFLMPGNAFPRWSALVREARRQGQLPKPDAALAGLIDEIARQKVTYDACFDGATVVQDIHEAVTAEDKSLDADILVNRTRLLYVGRAAFVREHPEVVVRAAVLGEPLALRELMLYYIDGGSVFPSPVSLIAPESLAKPLQRENLLRIERVYGLMVWEHFKLQNPLSPEKLKFKTRADLSYMLEALYSQFNDMPGAAEYTEAFLKFVDDNADYNVAEARDLFLQEVAEKVAGDAYSAEPDSSPWRRKALGAVRLFNLERFQKLTFPQQFGFLNRVVVALPAPPPWAIQAMDSLPPTTALDEVSRKGLLAFLDRIGDGATPELQLHRLRFRAQGGRDEEGALSRLQALNPPLASPLSDLRARLATDLALNEEHPVRDHIERALKLLADLDKGVPAEQLAYSNPKDQVPALLEHWRHHGRLTPLEAEKEAKAVKTRIEKITTAAASPSALKKALGALALEAQKESLELALQPTATHAFFEALRAHPGAAAVEALNHYLEKRPETELSYDYHARALSFAAFLWSYQLAAPASRATLSENAAGYARVWDDTGAFPHFETGFFGQDEDVGWVVTRTLLTARRADTGLLLNPDNKDWLEQAAKLPAVSGGRELVEDLGRELREGYARYSRYLADKQAFEAKTPKEAGAEDENGSKLVSLHNDLQRDTALLGLAEELLGDLATRETSEGAEARAELLAALAQPRERDWVFQEFLPVKNDFVKLRIEWEAAHVLGKTPEEAASLALAKVPVSPKELMALALALTLHKGNSPFDNGEDNASPVILPWNREFVRAIANQAAPSLPDGARLATLVDTGALKDFPRTKEEWEQLRENGRWGTAVPEGPAGK